MPAGDNDGPRTTTVRLSATDLTCLEQRARDLGYLQPRGPGRALGIGNVSALIRAIAAGDITLVRRDDPSTVQSGPSISQGLDGSVKGDRS